jgi:hypothetical protein
VCSVQCAVCTSARNARTTCVTCERKFQELAARSMAAFGCRKPLMPSRFEKFGDWTRTHQGNAGCLGAELGLSPTPDRLTEILITKIIDLCAAGECVPDRLCNIVVANFRAGEPRGAGSV